MRFEITRAWVNDDEIFIYFWWGCLFCCRWNCRYCIKTPWNQYKNNYICYFSPKCWQNSCSAHLKCTFSWENWPKILMTTTHIFLSNQIQLSIRIQLTSKKHIKAHKKTILAVLEGLSLSIYLVHYTPKHRKEWKLRLSNDFMCSFSISSCSLETCINICSSGL